MDNKTLTTLNIDKQEYTSDEILTIIGRMIHALKLSGKNTITINKNEKEFVVNMESNLGFSMFGSTKLDEN